MNCDDRIRQYNSKFLACVAFCFSAFSLTASEVAADCLDSWNSASEVEFLSKEIRKNTNPSSETNSQFSDYWISNTITDKDVAINPFANILLGFRSIQLDMPVRALASFERASLLISRGNVCEEETLEYFERVGRNFATTLILADHSGSENDLLPAAYPNLTKGIFHENGWLTDMDFELNLCVISEIGLYGFGAMQPSLMETCAG